jgi:hypothetical protein
MSRFYNLDGQPMTIEEWGALHDSDAKILDKTKVGDAEVSTVWLGLDHRFGDGPPLIFETMIFGGPHDEYQERYSTKEQAQTGHERVVAALRQGRDPEDHSPASHPTGAESPAR